MWETAALGIVQQQMIELETMPVQEIDSNMGASIFGVDGVREGTMRNGKTGDSEILDTVAVWLP